MKEMKEIMVKENLETRHIDDMRASRAAFAWMGDELEALYYLAKLKESNEPVAVVIFGQKGKMDERRVMDEIPAWVPVEKVISAGGALGVTPDDVFEVLDFVLSFFGLPTTVFHWDGNNLGGKA
jgi:hypothetical protein